MGVVVFGSKKFVESHDGQLFAVFLEDQYSRIFFNVRRPRVWVLGEPVDRCVQRLVDDVCSDRTTCLGQIAKAFCAFLDELWVVSSELVEHDWNQLIDVVNDLGLSRDSQYLVQSQENTEFFLFFAALQLDPEMLKDIIFVL
jgi:hypothetical protein